MGTKTVSQSGAIYAETCPLENKVEGPGHGGTFCLVKDFILHPECDVEPFRFVTEAGACSCC